MAVGVPETEVFAAADRVLARGERPTTERVRAELGRGSPARVGQLLEQWWEALAKRMAGETRLPDVPPAVAEAFKAVWVTASEHGAQLAQAELAETAAELVQERERLAEDWALGQREIHAARAAEAAAEIAAQTAQGRLSDLQRLLKQQNVQQQDLAAQREILSARNAQLEQALAAAQTALTDQQRHIRATEERAHAEIDRARQEAKELRARLVAMQREHTATYQQHRAQLEGARSALAGVERDATAQRARAEALEQQLARLGDLPATLQATLAQARGAGSFPSRERPGTSKTTKPRAPKPKSS